MCSVGYSAFTWEPDGLASAASVALRATDKQPQYPGDWPFHVP